MGRLLYAPALGGPVKPSPCNDVAELGRVKVFLEAPSPLSDAAEAGRIKVFFEAVGT